MAYGHAACFGIEDMAAQCILIADSARARILIATRSDEDGQALSERADLANPEASQRDRELFRGSKSQARASRGGTGAAYTLDDGRKKHREETARRFAKEVVRSTQEVLAPLRLSRLTVIAEPHFLGLLRPAISRGPLKKLELVEVPEEMSWHSLAHIERVLTKKGLLPPRLLPAAAFRPRGQAPAGPKKTFAPAAAPSRRA